MKRLFKKALPLLLAALAVFWLWWGNNTLSVEEYAFSSTRLPQGWDGARIVHLSDLHGKAFGRDSARLLRAVEKAQPEVIVITGDIADERSGTDGLAPLLEGLCASPPCTTSPATTSGPPV